MSYPTVELLARIERRRRFNVEQKLAVLAESTAAGANLSTVLRQHGLLPTQVYKWRRPAELGSSACREGASGVARTPARLLSSTPNSAGPQGGQRRV
jgi:transposase